MSKVVLSGSSETIKVTGKTIKGVSVMMQLKASAANQALTNTDYNLRNVTVKMQLRRRGQTFTIISTSLDVLLAICNYKQGAYFGAAFSNQTAPALSSVFSIIGKLVSPAVGVIGSYLIPIDFILPSPITLHGGDVVEITLTVPDATFIGNASSATSQFTFSEIECTGVEYGIPQVKVFDIQQGQSNVKQDLGNNCDRIYFINLDKKTTLTSDQVISSVSLSSNKLNYNKQYIELLAMRSNQTAQTYSDQLYQCFLLAEDRDLDQVTVDMQLVSGNVTTGNNYLVCVDQEYDINSVGIHAAINNIRNADHLEKVGAADDAVLAARAQSKRRLQDMRERAGKGRV